jgi:hypothetical protein
MSGWMMHNCFWIQESHVVQLPALIDGITKLATIHEDGHGNGRHHGEHCRYPQLRRQARKAGHGVESSLTLGAEKDEADASQNNLAIERLRAIDFIYSNLGIRKELRFLFEQSNGER